MKHYIREQPVRRCIECQSCIPCTLTGDGTWRCQEHYEHDENGRLLEFRQIPDENLQGDFPTWCAFADITDAQWDAHCRDTPAEKSRQFFTETEEKSCS